MKLPHFHHFNPGRWMVLAIGLALVAVLVLGPVVHPTVSSSVSASGAVVTTTVRAFSLERLMEAAALMVATAILVLKLRLPAGR